MTSKTTQYPLFFGFREPILGRGFVAGVDLHGRAVAEEEPAGTWWVYGVTPGALAGTGSTLVSAVDAFRARLKTVLVDYADEASNFSSFKSAVEGFCQGTDEEALAEWEVARQAVRAGRITLPNLSKDTTRGAPRISVVRLRIKPSANLVDGDHSCLAA